MATDYKIYIYDAPPQNSELGQLGGGTRRISITGTAVIQTWNETVESAENFVRSIFERAGWKLYNFDFQQISWTRLSGLEFSVNIVADVSNDYTNQQHLDFATRSMQSYVSITGNQTITNVYLKAEGAEIGTAPNGGQPLGLPYFLNPILPTNLFGSAGTTVLVVAAVLTGIIIFKR
jgi:hypothetical protein